MNETITEVDNGLIFPDDFPPPRGGLSTSMFLAGRVLTTKAALARHHIKSAPRPCDDSGPAPNLPTGSGLAAWTGIRQKQANTTKVMTCKYQGVRTQRIKIIDLCIRI